MSRFFFAVIISAVFLQSSEAQSCEYKQFQQKLFADPKGFLPQSILLQASLDSVSTFVAVYVAQYGLVGKLEGFFLKHCIEDSTIKYLTFENQCIKKELYLPGINLSTSFIGQQFYLQECSSGSNYERTEWLYVISRKRNFRVEIVAHNGNLLDTLDESAPAITILKAMKYLGLL
ncbi:MAG: hypothetical protein MUF24_07285 [Chitinophagaceae bacterium]|jgi:hypothetical protein|nr:hypothetical protein [Chitinophagaceae bacterium]